MEHLGCEFESAVSVNGMVCLNTFKSPTVQAVEGVLESDPEHSDEDDDILFTVYLDAKGGETKTKKVKRIVLNRQRSPGRLVMHTRKITSSEAKPGTADSGD